MKPTHITTFEATQPAVDVFPYEVALGDVVFGEIDADTYRAISHALWNTLGNYTVGDSGVTIVYSL